MTLTGVPQPLDQVLRPLVRVAQLVVGVTASAVFAFMGWWFWAPVPLAVSFLAYESLFWLRADRPIRVHLGRVITVRDRKRSLERTVDPATIVVATAQRRVRDDVADIRIVLADADGVALALWLRVPADSPPLPFEIDADLFDHIVGGDHGSLRALAAGDRIARQRIDTTAAALAWFREHIPGEAWQRTSCRVWTGAAPDLDLLGHHTGGPSAHWLLDGASITTPDGTEPIVWGEGARSERVAVLLHAGRGLNDTFAQDRLPLAILDLGPVRVAAPSRILMAEAPSEPADASLHHTHSAELSAIVAHLLRVVPQAQWPEHVAHAVADARALTTNIPVGD